MAPWSPLLRGPYTSNCLTGMLVYDQMSNTPENRITQDSNPLKLRVYLIGTNSVIVKNKLQAQRSVYFS